LLVRIAGSDTALPIRWSGDDDPRPVAAELHAAHDRLFGFRAEQATIVIESLELEAISPSAASPTVPPARTASGGDGTQPTPLARRPVWFDGAWTDTPLYDRAALAAGAEIAGPAVIVEANATTVVEPGWRAEVGSDGTLLLTRATPRASREALGRDVDPIMLEVFNALFMHVAEQLGAVLEQTAHSVNIKERLDFS